jgi:hypothetical protein
MLSRAILISSVRTIDPFRDSASYTPTASKKLSVTAARRATEGVPLLEAAIGVFITNTTSGPTSKNVPIVYNYLELSCLPKENRKGRMPPLYSFSSTTLYYPSTTVSRKETRHTSILCLCHRTCPMSDSDSYSHLGTASLVRTWSRTFAAP